MREHYKLGFATMLLVSVAVACVPAQAPKKADDKQAAPLKPAQQPVFEVLVQYRSGTKEADKAAVRKSVDGRLKESLSTPGLEVLLVPRTNKLDSPDRVATELRRSKAVRIAEAQQVYSKQSDIRD